jgi:hypothetical protein
VLRKTFESKREDVTGGWRKLCDGELHNFVFSTKYYLGDGMKEMRWSGHVARIGEMRNCSWET